MAERNPIILPEGKPKPTTGCPKCGHKEYTGRKVSGVITFTCRNQECRNQWQGGLPQELADPTKPLPPTSNVPDVQFVPTYNQFGNVVGFEEIRKPQDLRTDFRRGALVPNGEDD